MKKALPIIAVFVAWHISAVSQTTSELRIEPSHPITGKAIRIIYDAGSYSAFNDKDTLICHISKSYQPRFGKTGTEDIRLIKKGNSHEGSFHTSDSLALISLTIRDNAHTRLRDDNDGKGYLFIVYDKKDKPVQGALALQAIMTFRPSSVDSIKRGSLFEAEYKLHPSSKTDVSILALDYFVKSRIGDTTSQKQLENLIRRNVGNKTNSTEVSLTSAYDVFTIAKVQDAADSVKKLLVKKYPKGRIARRELGAQIEKTKDSAKLDSLYTIFKTSFTPYNPSKMQQLASLVHTFARKGYVKAIQDYEDKITDNRFKATIFNDFAWKKAGNGQDLDIASKYSQRSLALLEEVKANVSPLEGKSVIESLNTSFEYFADTYSLILEKQGNYADALKYQEQAVKAVKTPIDAIKERYAALLEKNNRAKEARPITEEVFMKKESKNKLELLKAIYKDEHGREDGFNEYLEKLRSNIVQFKKDQLAKDMMREKAPSFSAKTLDGKVVSLSDLKGKVVILDFWATWCGPCVASFPGMKAAQENLKADSNVVFLFVNTWENKPEMAKKFLHDNNYNFTVLMDNFNNGIYSTAKEYKVEGIPTKFIIDKDGYIRFRKIGFSGNSEETTDEISTMIKLANESK